MTETKRRDKAGRKEIPGKLEWFEGELREVVNASRSGWWRFRITTATDTAIIPAGGIEMTETETDEAFVERLAQQWKDLGVIEDVRRTIALARRGAAVRWRPISEYKNDGSEVLAFLSNGWTAKISYRSQECYDRYQWYRTPSSLSIPVVGTHPPDTDWKAHCSILATHFIPLTALGEPEDE